MKGNRKMIFGQNITREIFFFKNHVGSETGRLVPDLFLFFKMALYKVKANSLQLGFTIFRSPLNYHTIKTNRVKR